MIQNYKAAISFDAVIQDAATECKAAGQFNLTLAYELPVTSLSSSFVKVHRSNAEKWISNPPPRELFFSHGQFFKGTQGTDHVLAELERRKMSRRAMLAMIDMDALLKSADLPLPSFNILQFAIEANTLYVTAYFRALEVAAFLPTNLTEIALHCELIHTRFANIDTIRLTLLAFRAYYDPEFHCLEKLPIDSQPIGTIGVAVAEHRYEKLRTWLSDKRRVESVVELQGIEEMLNAVKVATKQYPADFARQLERAVESLQQFARLRGQFSEGTQVDTARKTFEQRLDDALAALPQ